MDRDDVVGRPTGAAKVTIERGPLAKFATAVRDGSPVYQDVAAARAAGFDDIPLPPTYAFSALQYWGKFPGDQPPDPTGGANPMMEIMGGLRSEGGGMILHGEQEFEYHRPVVAGETLTCEGKVTDFYSKESSSGKTMTFIVTEDVYRDAAGEPVLTSRMNLIHRA
ncbi:MAG: MaoC family dehydratase N-terminal domain-containing protein [Actinobacteria bacterium]|nr:MaoC family dehydratase N-terminal domain-containing protein [Actinomycetota bacterium]